MSKKITFLISTLICLPTLLGTADVFATDTGGEESMRYWMVEQMMELNDQVEYEKEQRCSGDKACERNFYNEIRMSDSPEYSALDMFNNFRIIVSRINPTTESLHLLYHDTDAMMRQFGEVERQVLNEFHLVWLDSYMPDPMSDFSYLNNGHPLFVDEIHENNLSNGVHLVMTKSVANNGQDWISPNQEVEFDIEPNVLISNTTNKLYYAAKIGIWQTHNYFDYSGCLNSPNYSSGMECRYVFYEDGTRGYLPFSVEKPEVTEGISTSTIEVPTTPVVATTNSASTEDTKTAKTSVKSIDRGISDTTKATDMTDVTNITDTTDRTDTTSVEVPLAADNEEEHIFPWWLIVFGFSGIFLVLWWFVPLRDQKKD